MRRANWQRIAIINRSTVLDWVAGAAQTFAGQGATYALGYQ